MAFSRKRGGGGAQVGGKPRSGSETRKREPIIGFRATAEERAEIQAAAQRAGLTMGSYVRSRAVSKQITRAVRRPPVETQQLARLLAILGAAGGAIQALAKQQDCETSPSAGELDAALKDFRAAAAAILQGLGKRPRLFQDGAP
jgi:uncharacterized protein (DUF1778 family)